MIYKNDLLDKNSIKIISYNYEESNGFSQETAVEYYKSKSKEHKIIVEFENQHYEILFKSHYSTSHYSAMEDVFVNNTYVITNKDSLSIKLINLKDRYDFDQVLYIENNKLNNNNQINNQIQIFIDKIIASANSLGIGLNYREHSNKEDDFSNTYPNIEHTGVSKISSNALFINDNEIDYFNKYILITDKDKSIQFIEDLENKIRKEALDSKNKIKEESLIESNKKQKIIQQYNDYENKIEQLLDHMTTPSKFIGFTIEEITSEIKRTEDEIKLLKENISLYDKIDEPYDEEYIIFEKYNKIEALKELIIYIPEQKKIEEELLKEFNYDIQLIKTLIVNNQYGYFSHCLDDYQEEEFKEQQEEPTFNSKEEWEYYQYTKPRSLKERFESIRLFINNQVSYEYIPSQLKTIFEIKNKSSIDLLNDNIKSKNNPNNKIKNKFSIK